MGTSPFSLTVGHHPVNRIKESSFVGCASNGYEFFGLVSPDHQSECDGSDLAFTECVECICQFETGAGICAFTQFPPVGFIGNAVNLEGTDSQCTGVFAG